MTLASVQNPLVFPKNYNTSAAPFDNSLAFAVSQTFTASGFVNWVCLTLGANPFLQRHHASAEQIDAGAAIHGTLEGLQFVDLPFGLPVAPRL